MSYKDDYTKYTWVIPAIAALLGLIALIVPPVVESMPGFYSAYYFWWGHIYISVFAGSSEFGFYFNEFREIFTATLAFFAAFAILIITLISKVVKEKRGEHTGTGQIVIGVLIIAILIVFYVVFDYAYRAAYIRMNGSWPSGYDAWDVVSPSFAFYLLIFSAIVSLIGGGVSKYVEKNPDIGKKVGSRAESKSYVPQSSAATRSANPQYNPANYSSTQAGKNFVQKVSVKFCPHCGAQQEEEGLFCGKCGGRF
ncbi:MAG: zinc ribbon domain-containing protein [Promethearchaeota archaeon]